MFRSPMLGALGSGERDSDDDGRCSGEDAQHVPSGDHGVLTGDDGCREAVVGELDVGGCFDLDIGCCSAWLVCGARIRKEEVP